MLCINEYPGVYVDACRARITSQLASYKSLVKAVPGNATGARAAFESHFFNHLVVVLDASFAHRSRTLELKDGNPLNEVRMLAASILQHDAVLTADRSIKYDPTRSVLGLAVGAPIRLTESDFATLSKAYFAEIEAKFV